MNIFVLNTFHVSYKDGEKFQMCVSGKNHK